MPILKKYVIKLNQKDLETVSGNINWLFPYPPIEIPYSAPSDNLDRQNQRKMLNPLLSNSRKHTV